MLGSIVATSWILTLIYLALLVILFIAIVGTFIVLRRLERLVRWWAEHAVPDEILPTNAPAGAKSLEQLARELRHPDRATRRCALTNLEDRKVWGASVIAAAPAIRAIEEDEREDHYTRHIAKQALERIAGLEPPPSPE